VNAARRRDAGDMMKLPRRKFVQLAAGAAVAAAAGTVRAQGYPAHPVRLLVGFPAGGQVDIIARLTAQFLGAQLGQTVVVENRPGAGGNLGAEAIVQAPPDGYTLFFAAASNAVNATLFEKLSYDFARDVTPISPVNRITLMFEAHPSFEPKSIAELITYARSNPGKVDIASPSVGTPPYMAVELLKMMAGLDIVHVPYGGEGQMVTDLLGGQLRVAAGGISPTIGHFRAGKLNPLAVTTAERAAMLPEVPTVGETVPGYEASGWSGVVAPRGTSPAIVDILYHAIAAMQADAKFKARIADLGVSIFALPPADFGTFIAEDIAKWGKVVKFAGLKPE
jgi:tripartite-type tricarboxylate transporter receptor subunit TctC